MRIHSADRRRHQRRRTLAEKTKTVTEEGHTTRMLAVQVDGPLLLKSSQGLEKFLVWVVLALTCLF